MTNKYIITNCPCLYEYGKGDCCNDLKYDQHTLCKDCTDCLLKQIVEMCKNEVCGDPYEKVRIGDYILAHRILELLEIQECE